jgi:hypothetical protein
MLIFFPIFYYFLKFLISVTISSVVKHGLQSFENSLRLLHPFNPGKIAAAVASFTTATLKPDSIKSHEILYID